MRRVLPTRKQSKGGYMKCLLLSNLISTCLLFRQKRHIILQVFLVVLFSAIALVRFNSTSSIAEIWEKEAPTKIIIHSDTNTIQAGPVGPISIPPSKMKLHYYKMWDHNTSTIDVPEKYQNPFNISVIDDKTGNKRRALTSLEILHNVLHGAKYQAEFEAAEAYANYHSQIVPECLRADVGATKELANRVVQERNKSRTTTATATTTKGRFLLPLPILNVGYPKAGSTSLSSFFHCLGMNTNHEPDLLDMFDRLTKGEEFYAAKQADAYMQLDLNHFTGFYPQIQFLDELHEKEPNSTLIINFRPIHDWIASVSNWHNMRIRMTSFLMPGLVMDDVQLAHAHAEGLSEDEKIKHVQVKDIKLSSAQLAKWWCGHALHIREYAKEYPSHSLIELDLLDSNGTTSLLSDLFRVDADNHWKGQQPNQCWGHSNKAKYIANLTSS